MVNIKSGWWMTVIPVLLSWLAVKEHSVILLAVFILIQFLILRICPACRHRESIWMFVMVAFSSIPVNVYLISVMDHLGVITGSFFITRIMSCALFYMMLLSAEEIIMGITVRLIWKKQYKIVI